MTNSEYMEAAVEILTEQSGARDKEFNGSLDSIVNLACTMCLRDTGLVRLGQLAKILKGRHKDYVSSIEAINWNEASIRIKGNPRWFCCWGDMNLFEVL